MRTHTHIYVRPEDLTFLICRRMIYTELIFLNRKYKCFPRREANIFVTVKEDIAPYCPQGTQDDYLYTHEHTHTRKQTRARAQAHKHTHIDKHTYIHTHTRTDTHTHACTRTYTRTQTTPTHISSFHYSQCLVALLLVNAKKIYFENCGRCELFPPGRPRGAGAPVPGLPRQNTAGSPFQNHARSLLGRHR